MLDQFALWRRTLGEDSGNEFSQQRRQLSAQLDSARLRVAHLVGEIGGQLPDLTVHDISHLDSLWRVADEILGPDYSLNPAEAFVLGCAFLLHDSAHVLAAYEDGLAGIKRSVEWRDLIAQRFGSQDPAPGSASERFSLFQVLRQLHAGRAKELPFARWKIDGSELYLIESHEVREYYGELIGEVAASHHWSPHRVATTLGGRHLNPPAFLAPAPWTVDTLKVALLLRTADAAHIDALRAPWFLFALRQPTGVSSDHWRFQAKLGQPKRNARGELRFTSGKAFTAVEQNAWWLAYDTASMVDRELRTAESIMKDHNVPAFAATSVQRALSPEEFAKNVRTSGWIPTSAAPKISDIPRIISTLGAAQLYGEENVAVALRELLQNSADAIRALRVLGGLDADEGEIHVAVEELEDSFALHITDSGIGMSRHVIIDVLLDFGRSLWQDEDLRSELPGLASAGFMPVGKFGIGFFSVFMLGKKVKITTRRFARADTDQSSQWVLEFPDGLEHRPTLRAPTPAEELRRAGTRVSIELTKTRLAEVLSSTSNGLWIDPILGSFSSFFGRRHHPRNDNVDLSGMSSIARLCPTLDVRVRLSFGSHSTIAVNPRDWLTLEQNQLLKRMGESQGVLLDLREPDGRIVGRIGFREGYGARAAVTYGGVVCGHVPKLAGVLLGTNNDDFSRLRGTPVASGEAWQKWAEQWIDTTPDISESGLAELHALCLARDVSVYRLGKTRMNMAELVALLSTVSEITVYPDKVTHSDSDDVSSGRFTYALELSPVILFLPSTDNALPKSLGKAGVDYLATLRRAIESTWGGYSEEDEDNAMVAIADGIDIVRPVYVFKRTELSMSENPAAAG